MAFLKKAYFHDNRVQKMDESIWEVWFSQLKDLEDTAFSFTVQKWTETEKNFPSISDLKQKTKLLTSDQLSGEDAWLKVIDNLRTGKYYSPTGQQNPLGHDPLSQTIRSMGIGRINEATDETMTFVRHQFLQAYDDFRETASYKQEYLDYQRDHAEIDQTAKEMIKKIADTLNGH